MAGDLTVSPVLVGEGAGAVRSVRPVAEVITEICDGAERILAERYASLLG